jgi:rubredoxin
MKMSWTCPKCQARNATIIARDADAGKIVETRCPACGAQHEASVFFLPTKAGAPMTVGVVWV